MNYATASALRQALNSRLANQSRGQGIPLARLRKTIAFDRFLVRLAAADPGAWVLKGGLALQLRLDNAGQQRARTTLDVDLQTPVVAGDVHRMLVAAARQDLGDWITFDITLAGADPEIGAQEPGIVRFHAEMLLDGRPFETFRIDVAARPDLDMPVEWLSLRPILAFADLAPARIRCYPVVQHLAEKTHAYARTRASGANTRVKDLVDIILIGELDASLDSTALRRALTQTFRTGNLALPSALPEPPTAWERPFRELARVTGLRQLRLADGIAAARAFLDPALSGDTRGAWDARNWLWKPAAAGEE